MAATPAPSASVSASALSKVGKAYSGVNAKPTGLTTCDLGDFDNADVPRDAKILSLLLSTVGVTEVDQRVVPQLLEFAHRYTVEVFRDAMVYSDHAVKPELDIDDIRLAIQGRVNHSFTAPPSKELIADLARDRNQIPLPLIPEKYGIRLPPERHCLTAVNFTIVPNVSGVIWHSIKYLSVFPGEMTGQWQYEGQQTVINSQSCVMD